MNLEKRRLKCQLLKCRSRLNVIFEKQLTNFSVSNFCHALALYEPCADVILSATARRVTRTGGARFRGMGELDSCPRELHPAAYMAYTCEYNILRATDFDKMIHLSKGRVSSLVSAWYLNTAIRPMYYGCYFYSDSLYFVHLTRPFKNVHTSKSTSSHISHKS